MYSYMYLFIYLFIYFVSECLVSECFVSECFVSECLSGLEREVERLLQERDQCKTAEKQAEDALATTVQVRAKQKHKEGY
jgi:hypothetical protein